MLLEDVIHLLKGSCKKKCGSKYPLHYIFDCSSCSSEIYIRKYDLKKTKRIMCFSCSNRVKLKNMPKVVKKVKVEKTNIYYKNCGNCQKLFIAKDNRAVFCSRYCRNRKNYLEYKLTKKGRYNIAKSTCTRSRSKDKSHRRFNLSLEEYTEALGDGTCFYCKGDIETGGTGLDRVDSNKCYEIGNVVPCCKKCNSVKSNILTKEETIEVVNLLKTLRKKEKIWN